MSYVTAVLFKRQVRLIKATPHDIAAYTGNHTVPVDVIIAGLPAPHDQPVFEATQCGLTLLAEQPLLSYTNGAVIAPTCPKVLGAVKGRP